MCNIFFVIFLKFHTIAVASYSPIFLVFNTVIVIFLSMASTFKCPCVSALSYVENKDPKSFNGIDDII